ncbi:MAG: hypothetical protein IJB10_03580 [Clostridia bacterium]|nr:hypothetical protein [Clostridia bacterium]
MKIKIFNKKAICNGCKKSFESGFEVDFDKRFFNTIKICQNCAKDFYTQLGKFFIPKNIKNINEKPKLINQKFNHF